MSHFPEFVAGVSVHLCETSAHMREEQVRKLKVRNIVRSEDGAGSAKTKKMTRADAEQAFNAAMDKMPKAVSDASGATAASTSTAATATAATSAAGPMSDLTKEELIIQSMLDGRNESPDQLMRGDITLLATPAGAAHENATADANSSSSSSSSSSSAAAAAELAALNLDPSVSTASIPIQWHSKVSQVPTDGGPLIVLAHEFFDALPLYQFVMTDRGWCEKLVDLDRSAAGPHHFRFVLSAQPTPASKTFLPPERFPPQDSRIGDAVEMYVRPAAGAITLPKRGKCTFAAIFTLLSSLFCFCVQLRVWSGVHGGSVSSLERGGWSGVGGGLRHEPPERPHAPGGLQAPVQTRPRTTRQSRPHRTRGLQEPQSHRREN